MCFYLLLEVLGLRELRVDLGALKAAHPVILLRQQVAAAVLEVHLALDLHRSELRDVIRACCSGVSASSRVATASRLGRRERSNRSRAAAGSRRSGLSSLGRGALLSGCDLSGLGPLPLRLLGCHGWRGLDRRGLRAARLCSCGLALLGRRPALEARDDLGVRDAVIVRHLLRLAVRARDGLHRQLLLEHSAVLLANKALELGARCQQRGAGALREVDPVVRVLLGGVRVLRLLLLLDLAASRAVGADADAALGGERHDGGEVRGGDRERERDVRGHFGRWFECY
jgi:hypothetical protein